MSKVGSYLNEKWKKYPDFFNNTIWNSICVSRSNSWTFTRMDRLQGLRSEINP